MVWQRISKKLRSDALKSLDIYLEQAAQKFDSYFEFWKPTELHDLRQRARNYLLHEVIENGQGTYVRPYSSHHMQIRKLFGPAKFVVDVAEIERKNPYENFEALAVRKGLKKEY